MDADERPIVIESEWRASVKAGDAVMVCASGIPQMRSIERATPTCVHVNGRCYWRSTGKEVNGPWEFYSVMQAMYCCGVAGIKWAENRTTVSKS